MSKTIASYEVMFVSGHILLEIPQQKEKVCYALIDTGSSKTLSSKKILHLCGHKFETNPSELFENSSHNLETLIGKKIDYLIGNDILSRFHFEIRKDKMSFYDVHVTRPQIDPSDKLIKCESISYPLERLHTLPIMEVKTPFKTTKMFFDTGAQLSYGSKNWFSPLPKDGSTSNGIRFLGEMNDFHPSIGEFKTDFYSMPVVITGDSIAGEQEFQGNAQLNMKFGVLPNSLEYMITSFKGVEGIFGSEVLEYCNAVFLTNERMYIY